MWLRLWCEIREEQLKAVMNRTHTPAAPSILGAMWRGSMLGLAGKELHCGKHSELSKPTLFHISACQQNTLPHPKAMLLQKWHQHCCQVLRGEV